MKELENTVTQWVSDLKERINVLPQELQLRILIYIDILSRADINSLEYRASLQALEEETKLIRGLGEKAKPADL